MSPIEDRLRASLKYDAINGDTSERFIVSSQIREAINEIENLRKQLIALAKKGG